MPCPLHPRSTSRAALLLLAALAGGVGCTSSTGDEDGTPLPEPPDGLPRPTWNGFSGPESTDAVAAQGLFMVVLGGNDILVKPNSQVWVINLDQPRVPPAVVMARDDGRFVLPIDAADNDRLRVLARTETEHSPPLDLVAIAPKGMMPARARPGGTIALDCLKRSAAETLVFEGNTGRLELDNQCPAPVTITNAALRLGDRGIALGEVPASIAPGEQVTLTFTDSMGPGTVERLDVLLLELDSGNPLSHKYAIDLFTDLE